MLAFNDFLTRDGSRYLPASGDPATRIGVLDPDQFRWTHFFEIPAKAGIQ